MSSPGGGPSACTMKMTFGGPATGLGLAGDGQASFRPTPMTRIEVHRAGGLPLRHSEQRTPPARRQHRGRVRAGLVEIRRDEVAGLAAAGGCRAGGTAFPSWRAHYAAVRRSGTVKNWERMWDRVVLSGREGRCSTGARVPVGEHGQGLSERIISGAFGDPVQESVRSSQPCFRRRVRAGGDR